VLFAACVLALMTWSPPFWRAVLYVAAVAALLTGDLAMTADRARSVEAATRGSGAQHYRSIQARTCIGARCDPRVKLFQRHMPLSVDRSQSRRAMVVLLKRLGSGWRWTSSRGLRLGEVLLQPRDSFRHPVANIRHLDPCVDVVRRGVDMAVADPRLGCHEHVQHQLEKSCNRVPRKKMRERTRFTVLTASTKTVAERPTPTVARERQGPERHYA